jgi:hypothetical protein
VTFSSSTLTPREGMGRGWAPSSMGSDIDRHAPLTPLGLRGQPSWGRWHPCTTLHRQDNTARRWRPVRHPTIQIWYDKKVIRPHPLQDGTHDPSLDNQD